MARFFPYILSAATKLFPLGVAIGFTRFGGYWQWDDLNGPLEIATTRFQHCDFKRESVGQYMRKMWANERGILFETGLYHAQARNLLIYTLWTCRKQTPDSVVPAIVIATILSHPFEVLRVRQMWASQGGEAQKLEVGENIYKGLKLVMKEDGLAGLMRGLSPRLAFFFIAGMSIFSAEECVRREGD